MSLLVENYENNSLWLLDTLTGLAIPCECVSACLPRKPGQVDERGPRLAVQNRNRTLSSLYPFFSTPIFAPIDIVVASQDSCGYGYVASSEKKN